MANFRIEQFRKILFECQADTKEQALDKFAAYMGFKSWSQIENVEPYADGIECNEIESVLHSVARVGSLPVCSFCPDLAGFDFKSIFGPWAYGCKEHYFMFRQFNTLGLGKGQKLELVRRFKGTAN